MTIDKYGHTDLKASLHFGPHYGLVSMALMRSIILRKTVEVAARDGINAFVVKSVSKECGCSEGLIFHYFSTKKELVDICYQYICEEFTKRIYSEAGEDLELRSVWRSYRGFMEDNKDSARFCLEYIQSNDILVEGLDVIRDSIDRTFPGKDDGFLDSTTRSLAVVGCMRGIGLIQWELQYDDDYRLILEKLTDELS